MNGAIVVSWGAPVRGRETKGLETFGQALAHFDALAKKGRVHGHHEYISVTGNASKLSGFQIIDGELTELQKILTEDDTQRLILRAQNIVENFTVQLFTGGSESAIQHEMTRYAEVAQEQGYLT
jgi:hypothetical protein